MASEDDVPGRQRKPLLIVAEDIEVEAGAAFRSEVAGAGHVVQRTERLTLGDGSSYFASIAATSDADSTASDKRKQSLYFPEQMLQEIQIGQGATFESRVVGSPNDDLLEQRFENVEIRGGTMRMLTDTGAGNDTATIVFVGGWGASSYQYAFDGGYNLGGGADLFTVTARDVVVPEASSFDLGVDGQEGRDLIWADIEATVDGHYRFRAAGGRGADVVGTVHRLAATRLPRDGAGPEEVPAIDILLAGEEDNDLLAAWLFAVDLDENSIRALIDGGRGIDLCLGNVDAINCEL
jgi:hypothetical protein